MKLTPEQMKQNAAAIIAFADGKPTQMQTVHSGAWTDWPIGDSNLAGFMEWPCRPKPESKARPWSKPDDVPGPICWIRPKGEPWNSYLIHTMGGEGRPLEYGDGFKQQYPISTDWEYSTDRKTWHKCEVTE